MCIRDSHSIHHGAVVGVDDGKVQTMGQGQRKKGGIDNLTFRQAEGDVGNAQNGFDTQALLHHLDGPQRFPDLGLLYRGGQR